MELRKLKEPILNLIRMQPSARLGSHSLRILLHCILLHWLLRWLVALSVRLAQFRWLNLVGLIPLVEFCWLIAAGQMPIDIDPIQTDRIQTDPTPTARGLLGRWC